MVACFVIAVAGLLVGVVRVFVCLLIVLLFSILLLWLLVSAWFGCLLLWFACGSLLLTAQGLLIWLVCSFKRLWV